jgi:hypothetical protein
MRVTICLVFAAILFSCCKSKQDVAKSPTPAAPPTSTSDEIQAQKDAYNNIVISFYSVGEGINANAIDTIENFIAEYSKKINKAIPYSKISWGREGEVDFCISLAEIEGEQKRIFVQETRRLARQYEHINFYENHPCRELK